MAVDSGGCRGTNKGCSNSANLNKEVSYFEMKVMKILCNLVLFVQNRVLNEKSMATIPILKLFELL